MSRIGITDRHDISQLGVADRIGSSHPTDANTTDLQSIVFHHIGQRLGRAGEIRDETGNSRSRCRLFQKLSAIVLLVFIHVHELFFSRGDFEGHILYRANRIRQ